MAKRSGPWLLHLSRLLGKKYGKRYKMIFANRLDKWIRKTGAWRIKEALPQIENLITQLIMQEQYLSQFKFSLLAIKGKRYKDTGNLKAQHSKYARGIKLCSKSIKINLGKLRDLLEQAFFDLEVAEDCGHGMQYSNMKKLQKDADVIRKEVTTMFHKSLDKIKKSNKSSIEALKKSAVIPIHELKQIDEKLRESSARLDKDYQSLLSHVQNQLQLASSKMVEAVRIEWEGSKRQARGFSEPIVRSVHISSDQLARKVKVLAKESAHILHEEGVLSNSVQNSGTFHEFKIEFDKLIKLYMESTNKLHELVEWVKVLVYRLEQKKRKLNSLIQLVQKNEFVEKNIVNELRNNLYEMREEIHQVLARLEIQARLLLHEVQAKLSKTAPRGNTVHLDFENRYLKVA